MLKVTMIIDNKVASPDTPEEFIKNSVLSSNSLGLYNLIDIKVEQESKFEPIETIQNKIEELEKLNKSLECCGNCGNEIKSDCCKHAETCYRSFVCDPANKQDNWTIRIAKGIK